MLALDYVIFLDSNIRCKKVLSSFPALFMLINRLAHVWDSLQFKGKAQSPIG